MKRALSLGLVALGVLAAAPAPRGLEECFQAAVQRSETISERELSVAIAREKESQARGSMLPNLSAQGSYTRQEQPSDPFYRAFAPADEPEAKVVLTQPLFRGLRDLATLNQLKALTAAQELAKAQALDQLFLAVVQNYYSILADEQDVRNLKALLGEYKQRTGDLQRRARTGQSNRSDAMVAEASESAAETQLTASQGQLGIERQTFAFLTGLAPDTPLVDDAGEPGPPPPLAGFLAHLGERPDVAGAKAQLKASDEAIRVQKGQHLPSADLQGEYFLKRPPGYLSQIHWDVTATLTLPLYSGGIIQSQIHEAEAAKQQADLEVQRLGRKAEEDVRSDYATLASDVTQFTGLMRTAQLSRRNYQLLRGDYRRGLTANTDVLLALTQFQTNLRSADRQRYTSRVDFLRLETDAAERPFGPHAAGR